MTDKRYWLWLALCLGEGAKFKEILEDFGSVEKLYNSNVIEWKMSPALTPAHIEKLTKYTLDSTQEILSDCEKNNWDIITYDDERYPQRLREISAPPAVLYSDGAFPDFENNASISIVGTRRASTYALKAAHIMAKGFALCGGLVVSGGALGVDSAAHKGAIEAGGKTYAVLGCGFGSQYLMENEELRTKIKESGGALISEFPPKTPAVKYNFPMRNRIISALTLGTLVVEAGEKSGSLITASYATEQNRDIFAIPASIFDSKFLGTNLLINDGAIVATSPAVIIQQYAKDFESLDESKILGVKELAKLGDDYKKITPKEDQISFDNMPRDRVKRIDLSNKSLKLPPSEKAVFDVLEEELKTVEEIAQSANLTPGEVLASLTLLEMKGLIVSASGQRYKIR
ncbi:MAG: DNA-processing protein DprA [Eubacterium sp.]|nr:DNA-processing protein DprA [Eubacterium sp.]